MADREAWAPEGRTCREVQDLLVRACDDAERRGEKLRPEWVRRCARAMSAWHDPHLEPKGHDR